VWYKEVLGVRRSLLVYVIVVALVGVFNAWGAGDSGGIILSQALEVSCFAAIVLALVVGTSLGRELSTQARSALMRPTSRERYAWTIFAVDLAAATIAYVAAAVIVVGTFQAAHGFASMDLRGVTPLSAIVLPLAAIFAFYGVTAACALATRGAVVTAVLLGPTLLALWVGAEIYKWPAAAFFRVFSLANPLIYLAAAITRIEHDAHPDLAPGIGTSSYAVLSVSTDATILLVIAIVTLALATFLWRRAEA
jgi:hypothetical protein